MTLPLSDIRVCDLTQNLAGPFCGQVLADLGADVIKVEPPGGDTARPWGPPFWGGDSTLFLSVNRGKRSIVLDLKREAGREALHRIVRASDVVVESARPGVPERLGYDEATLRALRPRVIYAVVSAFGDRGPLKDQPGYDPLLQAYAGIMSVTGHPEGPPARVGCSLVDFGTGMWAAIAVLGALRERDRTGRGGRVDTALLDTALGWVPQHLMGYLATGRIPGPMGTALASIAPYEAFPTSDGQVMISAGNDAIFGRLCRALGLDGVSADPRFRTNPERVAHRDVLRRLVSEKTRGHGSSELIDLLRRHDVPCAPIQDMAEVAEDPQVEAVEMLTSAPRAEVPDYADVSLPLRLDGERPRAAAPPPRKGEHTRAILEESGYSRDEVEVLLKSGVAEAP